MKYVYEKYWVIYLNLDVLSKLIDEMSTGGILKIYEIYIRCKFIFNNFHIVWIKREYYF